MSERSVPWWSGAAAQSARTLEAQQQDDAYEEVWFLGINGWTCETRDV